MKAFLTLFTLGITASGTAQTQRFEDINGLEAMVVAKFGAAIGQPGGPAAPIDRRLKLAACPDTPSVEGPVMGAAVIRCAPVVGRIRFPLRAGEWASPSAKPALVYKKAEQVNPKSVAL